MKKKYFLKVLKINTDYSVFTSDIEIDVKKSQFSIAANTNKFSYGNSHQALLINQGLIG